MNNLHEKFIENMKEQLPKNEWEAFFACYDFPPVKGVRLNVLKGGRDALKAKLPFLGERVEWEENGFYATQDKLGANVFHAAGLFYSQEPSAMSAAPLLNVQKGERVLDLCSAPGGKGTQLASKMQGEGIIVLNEPIFSRAKILSQNVERLGIKNAVVTSLMPEKLAEKFTGYFDKVLVDAPCSGEGMFRKNAEEALREWSEENVELCAKRQAHILHEATSVLRVGGMLVYSTCTFSYAEDEGQVFDYLQKHPNMRLIKQEKLYPHKVKGEGHFVALFEKIAGDQQADLKGIKRVVSRETDKQIRVFESTCLQNVHFENLHEAGGAVYALPKNCFSFDGIQILRAGIKLGEMKNGRFEPDHALVMASEKGNWKNALDLSQDDERVRAFLHGESITLLANEDLGNGWCAVCVEGYPIGLGKAVNGVIKNHLPKGLRALSR